MSAPQPAIFISAVSRELRSARALVAQTLTFLGYQPITQEIFGTEGGDLRDVLCRKIDGCQAVVQLVGREHRHRIEQAAARQRGAHDDIRDGHAEQHVEERRGARVFQRVHDRGDGEVMAERVVIMGKRPLRGQRGAIPLARKRHEDHRARAIGGRRPRNHRVVGAAKGELAGEA